MFTRLEIRSVVAINRCHLVFTVDAGTNLGLGNSSTFERFNVGGVQLLIPGLHFTWFLTGSLTCCLGRARCTFLYHYMGASVFAGPIAWLRFACCRLPGAGHRYISRPASVFWMPVYLGLPLSELWTSDVVALLDLEY